MSVVGFTFTSLEGKREIPVSGNVTINSSISLTNVEKQELTLGKSKEDSLKIAFEFTVTYEPGVGHITLAGELVFLADAKNITSFIDSWKKTKALPPAPMEAVLNSILSRCTIHALLMSRDLNLPPAYKLPEAKVTPPPQK
ncbi:hypothetical protein HZB02_05425 [Candidatus Woesearchaeota archaeon]|nr:hypothetical protein [Candidatus Woesearchaeota archaeon]